MGVSVCHSHIACQSVCGVRVYLPVCLSRPWLLSLTHLSFLFYYTLWSLLFQALSLFSCLSFFSSLRFPLHHNYPSSFYSPSAFQLLPFHIKVKHPLLPRWGWDKYWLFIVFLGTHAPTTSNAHTSKHTHTRMCVWIYSLCISLHIFLYIRLFVCLSLSLWRWMTYIFCTNILHT